MTLVSYKTGKPIETRPVARDILTNSIHNPSSEKGMRNVANPDDLENEYAELEASKVVDAFFNNYSNEPVFLNRLKGKMIEKLYQVLPAA